MARYVTKRYSIQDVVPSMIVGNSVLCDNGRFILNDGIRLTLGLIDQLKSWGVEFIDIREKAPPSQVETDGPLRAAEKKFYKRYNDTVEFFKKSFESVRYLKMVPLNEMRGLADQALRGLVDVEGAVNFLLMVRHKDDYTFHHCINVAIFSGILGRWLNYSGSELRELILAGLLHDIGKAHIPLEILNKQGKLLSKEMEIMKRHTSLGYELLKNAEEIPLGIKLGVLQHHERMDGSGYPLKLPGDKIHPYARVIAVADIYDAMTSDRVYRRRTTPFKVVEMVMANMFDELDPIVCTTFLNNVRDYFVGNIIRLSDGRQAEVVFLSRMGCGRPVVRTEDGEFIDLEKHKSISIVEMVKG